MSLFLLLLVETQPDVISSPALPPVDFSWLFLKVIGAMIIVCAGAFFVIKYLLPRGHFVRRAQSSEIEVLERFPLEPKKNLYILKVAKKRILLGTTESSLSSLMELPEVSSKHEEPADK